ncbi:AsmA family protein [Varunaivibrio sulfuroxidans]|uniref:AsmA-like protein n=1 Tax=Varunaivibrio sulfuroxidans TaxID=1773489 RepID=A0A4V2UP97_9PROT|nr:hypothetical protein [Varunaivibrio sulfuroxidans]TCS64321.1 hypothetical protein EDD55_102364 [Varunaivibrio sulfuroxidans]WES31242.1 hypothetical protein P3M64_02385 [Varunaivibrio sulfuroxidans]
MKKILIVVGILAVLVGGGVAYLYSSLDEIITATVQKVGSRMMLVDVTLKKTKLSLTSGRGEMDGLKVGNPQGYNTNYAASLGKVVLEVDVNTVIKNPTIIHGVFVEKPEVTYEIGGNGSNITAIQKNVEGSLSRLGIGGTGTGTTSGQKPPKKFIIENLIIRDGVVRVSATMFQGKTLDVPLPKIHLRDIGRKKGGLTSNEIVLEVVNAMTKAATEAAMSTDLSKLGLDMTTIDNLKTQVKGLLGTSGGAKAVIDQKLGAAKKIIEQTTGGSTPIENAPQEIQKKLGGAQDQLKNLFGN